MSTHNIFFTGEIGKNDYLDSLLTWCATTYKFAKTNVELMPQKLCQSLYMFSMFS